MVGPWWRLRCHIVDAAGEAIEHRAQGWRDCGEQRGPRHAAVLGMSADVLSVAVQSASSLLIYVRVIVSCCMVRNGDR